MKVLHINTSDTAGGAAIAAFRLHKAMLEDGIDSRFFCLNRTINDDERILTVSKKTKILSRTVDLAKQIAFRKNCLSSKKGLFSNFFHGHKISKEINISQYDIIYIHWVNGNFLSFNALAEILKTGKQVYWFMHDMFPITGGCHYSFECKEYEKKCGNCPYLKNKNKKDFSFKQLNKKKKLLKKYRNLSFVAPSRWLYECAKSSAISKECGVRVFHVPNLLNSKTFKPMDKYFCRSALNIPQDKKVILFGAAAALVNPYKGFDYLEKSLSILSKNPKIKNEDILLVIFGSSYNSEIEKRLPFKTKFMGYLHDSAALNLLYNAFDVFCIPSLAENFANTILESVFCKTPAVGFNVGGIPDVVNNETGYLAEYKDSADFAEGISKILLSEINPSFVNINQYEACKVVERHKMMWKNNGGGYSRRVISVQSSLREAA